MLKSISRLDAATTTQTPIQTPIQTVVGFVILFAAALSRTFPHVVNATPVLGATLLAGYLIGRQSQRLAVVALLVSMLVSDAIIGFHWTQPFVYGGLAMALVIGRGYGVWAHPVSPDHVRSGSRSALVLGAGALAASVAASLGFFAISNIGVFFVGELYPLTAQGLRDCFELAIPFFKNSFRSDLIFGTLMLTVATLANEAFAVVKASAPRGR